MTGSFGVSGAEVAGVGAAFGDQAESVAAQARPLADCALHGGTAGAPFRAEGAAYAELMSTLGRRVTACAAAVASIGDGLRSVADGYDTAEDERSALFTRLDGGAS